MENNNYVVIQPPSDEGDAEEQIDQVFGSKINSQSQKKASSSSLKLDIGQSNQLYLNDPKMDSFRGYDRPSPYRQHEAASTSPLESVFRSSLPSVREEASYNNGYHQSLQSVMGPPQDTR